MAQARQRAEHERRSAEERFRRAPFPLYGLPLSWQGGRFLGGCGWGSDRSGKETIHALSLLHGFVVQSEGPSFSVESAVPNSTGGGGDLRLVAEALWRGRASTVGDAVDTLTRDWGDPPGELFPLPVRAHVVVPIQSQAISFDVLTQSNRWVGWAEANGCWITLEGRRFDLEGLALVQVVDLDPYILGSRSFEERRTGTTGPPPN